MGFQVRLARVADLRWCREILEDGFDRRPDLSGKLPGIWAALIAEDALKMIVTAEEKTGIRVAFGAGGIVSDEFADLTRKATTPNVAVRLMERELEPKPPYLLRPQEIRRVNHPGHGVNLCVVHYSETENRYTADEQWVIRNKAVRSLLGTQSGYSLKEFIMEFYGEQDVSFMLSLGAKIRTDYGHGTWPEPPPKERRPYLTGLSLHEASEKWGSPIASLFSYSKPRLFFSIMQQRVLVRAALNEPDSRICEELGVMESTIREHWRAIYDRVFDGVSAGTVAIHDLPDRKAGASRLRPCLLKWLDDHPEELRAVDRRYFTGSAEHKRSEA